MQQSVTDWLIAHYPDLTADFEARREKGKAEYGTELMSLNGRDARRDALEEALDLAMYIAQMRLEEPGPGKGMIRRLLWLENVVRLIKEIKNERD